MGLRRTLATTVAAGLLSGTAAFAQTAPIAVIELSRSAGMIRIEGIVEGGSGDVTAKLVIQHIGKGGSMNTSQGRQLTLAEGERLSVAVTQVNFGPESSLTMDLVVETEAGVLSHSQTRISPETE